MCDASIESHCVGEQSRTLITETAFIEHEMSNRGVDLHRNKRKAGHESPNDFSWIALQEPGRTMRLLLPIN